MASWDMASWREELAGVGYRLGWAVVRFIPPRLSTAAGRLIADRVSDHGRGMEQLRRNLSRVVGPTQVTSDLVARSVRSYMRYWIEVFRLPDLHADPQVREQLQRSVQGAHYLEQSLAAGRGVIIALPHSGNWDMAGVYLVDKAGQFSTVAERLKPESLFDAFVRFRRGLGFEVFAHRNPSPYPVLKQRLEEGQVVCLLADRDLGRSGIAVEFFGDTASFATGPARLAIETGAALHIAHCWFDGAGWGFSVSAAVEVDTVAATTQRIADGFAANIAAHPEDWHMLQKIWLADLDPDDPRRQR